MNTARSIICEGHLRVVEGTARLNLDTRDGQEVPEMTDDSRIEVAAADSGHIVLTNTLHVDSDHISANHSGIVFIGDTIIMIAPNGLNYQWKKDGVIINGAGSKTIVIEFAVESDSGVYTVVYENGLAKALIESPPVVLTVVNADAVPTATWCGLVALAVSLGVSARFRVRGTASE
jgi:hypothetical protein